MYAAKKRGMCDTKGKRSEGINISSAGHDRKIRAIYRQTTPKRKISWVQSAGKTERRNLARRLNTCLGHRSGLCLRNQLGRYYLRKNSLGKTAPLRVKKKHRSSARNDRQGKR